MNKFTAILLMILALFAFVVQGMANAVMACEAHMQGHDMPGTMMTHQHASMDNHLMSHSEPSMMSHSQHAMDCCDEDTECVCLTHACGSAQLLPVAEFFLATDLSYTAALWQENQPPVAVARSLYRPPIFA
ncbi:hypothetical protein [Pseudoalteromonas ardens]|uniref:hypothetical protein n=1 Tax=Pseudoalteromonas ardens TaxID=3048490 RepID=UPI0024C3699D|nr:hypothetical protein [Pseudoalteromonas sp. R96]MDK1312090.1 hypothetical protein [Pseudoalteromonas sp. R96]